MTGGEGKANVFYKYRSTAAVVASDLRDLEAAGYIAPMLMH